MKIIDMRSDTVTKPTPEMREAMARAEVGDDVYGDDMTTIELERLAAEMSGKEAALFVPSGTFGNQLALFTHCARGQEVVIYEDCHIVEHEAGAASVISGIQLRTISGPGSLPDAREIEKRIRTGADEDIHKPYTGLICLESTHSDGRVIPLERLREIRGVADRHSLPIHLDGARLFNAADYLGVPAAEIAKYANSVMFCLSKGLCAPVGSMLAGTAKFVEAARRRRKLMGGGMRQTGILAAAGIIALRKMTKRLGEDRGNALLLAEGIARLPYFTTDVGDVHANLVFFNINNAEIERQITTALETRGVLANPPENGLMRLATHNGVSREDISVVLDILSALSPSA